MTDDSGARVPGAAITVRNTETGITRSVTTDAGGRYRAPNLGLGLYEVRAEMMGFRTAVRQGIQVTVAAESNVNLTLSIGAVAEQVVVTGEAPLIETTSATLSGLVDDKKIRDLPLNGRSFEQLAFLQTGVVPFHRGGRATDQGEGTKFSVTGSRIDSNSFLLDGIGIYDQSNTTPGAASGQLLGVEMLREFRVLTGAYSAEYGRFSGGVITAATKSGSNEMHGNLFAFHRNDNLDARNFFDRQESPDSPRLPEFKRNQFGGTLGGPIFRDRTFIFGGYEGLRERLGVSNVAIVPDANAHNGLLPCGVVTPAPDPCPSSGLVDVGVAPNAAPRLALYPLPNGSVLGDGTAELFSSPTRPVRQDYFAVRVDHKISDSDFFYARYNFDDTSLTDPSAYPTINTDSVTRSQYVTADYQRIISPTFLNEVRAGLSRAFSNQFNQPLFEPADNAVFIPGTQLGLLTFRGAGITEYGGRAGYPRRIGHNVWQLGDDVTISRGSHALKMGFAYERTQSNANFSRVYGGQAWFGPLQEFLGGQMEEFSADLPGTDNIRGWRQNFFGFYIQDDFQVRPNLTLNLGLRYEFTTVPTEVNGKIANWRNPLTDTEITVGDPWIEKTYKDFGPRIGLSWDPFSNGKTAIRAGFGMYFDHLTAQPLNRVMTRTPPFSLTARTTNLTPDDFPHPRASLLASPSPRSIVSYSMQPHMQDPAKIGFSLSIQQEVTQQMVVNAAYAGSHSYHQINGNNGNNAYPSDIIDGRKFFAAGLPRRNPNIGQLQFMITPEGSSTYHSLQLSANRRFSAGLQMQLSYTYSKYLSDSDGALGRTLDAGGTVPQDSDDFGAERGLATPDIRNYFSMNYTYDLPFAQSLTGVAGKVLSGWQLNGILSLGSGTAFNILTGFNRSRSLASGTQITDRPNLAADYVGKNLTEGVSAGCQGVPAGAELGTPERWFDACAFELPEAGFYGNLGRNTLIAPGLANFDFALIKNTSLGETKSLSFRAEFFNLLNRVNFDRPETARTRIFSSAGTRSGTAGRITSILGTSRQIQLGLKFTF